MRNLGLVAAIFLFLSGCADKAIERSGSDIHVVPVTYSIALNIEKNKRNDGKTLTYIKM